MRERPRGEENMYQSLVYLIFIDYTGTLLIYFVKFPLDVDVETT